MNEPEIHVESRDELTYLLAEAAEIEHGLMCCYLYAAWSLKRGDELAGAQRDAVERWRRSILDVAKDEMVHLALVQNVLLALGSGPHFERSNFPVSPGYHPAGVVVSLAPFDRATLDHFVYLERPEGVDLPDGEGFVAARQYRRGQGRGRLVPNAQDYATVGHLYRGIRDGLGALARSIGEAELFVGDPAIQVGADVMPLEGMAKVRNLAEAESAIDTIVNQGEGASEHRERSHYAAFTKMRDEYAALLAADPSFEPARPAARNPVMRPPPTPDGKVWVAVEPASTKLDLANAMYALMLRALRALFSPITKDATTKASIAELVVTTMRVLGPLAEELTTLPATDDPAGPRAGVTFTMSRSLHAPADMSSLRALAEATFAVAARSPDGAELGRIATELARASTTTVIAPVAQAVAAPPMPVAPAAPAAPASTDGIEVARGKSLTVLFEGKRCIHSRGCVLDAPTVFLANTPGEWIFPDTTSTENLIGVAHGCPSGAIRYERHDGGPEESAPEVNVARVRENGPIALHAAIALEGQGEPTILRATLCRCGASKNKPFCDGSHKAVDFQASGEPKTLTMDPLAQRGGTLEVRPRKNGPLAVRGNLELCSGTGRVVSRLTVAMLCRCGGSANKPFCDGTHAKNGFTADGS